MDALSVQTIRNKYEKYFLVEDYLYRMIDKDEPSHFKITNIINYKKISTNNCNISEVHKLIHIHFHTKYL